ncbi:hypothetical protein QVD17_37389 [Tagetes erecta]|uniref:Wall-associated receptor kinase galacturonan-binding domain-containing protein n=1 Tax=Tagetes erecta TaxID=13708 RepID=A0AAD8JVY0_TARER|nr:hypothetical protein QVD17_37389 [Tagetes erecta]
MKLFLTYMPLLVILILTATSPAIAKYAKKGCDDMCGNVRIPYPFGVGAHCSLNSWYTVDCKFSKPYLSALNQLEVLSIDLNYQIVTVNTTKITNCQKVAWNSYDVLGVDLGESPFLFSKSHNKFVFEGCGIATMMNGGSMVTGCSTSCLNGTFSDINDCDGNNCCRIGIPHYLKSYNINVERKVEDRGCGSAFLVDWTPYEESRFSFRNTSFIPISLLWTLTDSDHVPCCDKQDLKRLKVDMFNSTPMDTRRCQKSTWIDNPYVIDGCREDGM